MNARHIQVKRGTFGLLYILHGIRENGDRTETRVLTVPQYSELLARGIPVVREEA